MKIREMWEEVAMLRQLNRVCGEDVFNKAIDHYMKRIRKAYREEREQADPYRVAVFKDDGYGYYEKLIAEDSGETVEEVEEWFYENYFIPYYNRGYDCTGQLFTAFHRVFRVAGQWVIYHRVNIDC